MAILWLRASKTPRNSYNIRYRRCTDYGDEATLPGRRTQKMTTTHKHCFHVGITLPVAMLCTSPNRRSPWNALLTPCRLASTAPTECTDNNAALWTPETHEDGCRVLYEIRGRLRGKWGCHALTLLYNEAVARKHKYVLVITSTENLLLSDYSVLIQQTLVLRD